jgi:putative transposase
MTRLRRIEKQDRIFFVTTNLARGTASLSPAERDLILQTVALQRQHEDLLLFAFVLMPTHAHFLLAPRNKDLVRIFRDLKSETGYRIARGRNMHGAVWQESYFDRIVRRPRDFWKHLDYIHQNPVTANLVSRPEDWLWSSYRQIVKQESVIIQVDAADFPSGGNYLLRPAPGR